MAISHSKDEIDPNKPWLYARGNRLDPSDRLVTPLTQYVPDFDENGQLLSDIVSENMRFGLSASITGQLMNNIVSESITFTNV